VIVAVPPASDGLPQAVSASSSASTAPPALITGMTMASLPSLISPPRPSGTRGATARGLMATTTSTSDTATRPREAPTDRPPFVLVAKILGRIGLMDIPMQGIAAQRVATWASLPAPPWRWTGRRPLRQWWRRARRRRAGRGRGCGSRPLFVERNRNVAAAGAAPTAARPEARSPRRAEVSPGSAARVCSTLSIAATAFVFELVLQRRSRRVVGW
jgi:hypothetical protein